MEMESNLRYSYVHLLFLGNITRVSQTNYAGDEIGDCKIMHAVSLRAIAERDFPPCGGNLAWNYCYEIMASLGIATAYENTVYYACTFGAYNRVTKQAKLVNIYTYIYREITRKLFHHL